MYSATYHVIVDGNQQHGTVQVEASNQDEAIGKMYREVSTEFDGFIRLNYEQSSIDVLTSMVEDGLIQEENGIYSLTDFGREVYEEVNNDWNR